MSSFNAADKRGGGAGAVVSGTERAARAEILFSVYRKSGFWAQRASLYTGTGVSVAPHLPQSGRGGWVLTDNLFRFLFPIFAWYKLFKIVFIVQELNGAWSKSILSITNIAARIQQVHKVIVINIIESLL